jgi:phage FluMu gp28-like protein
MTIEPAIPLIEPESTEPTTLKNEGIIKPRKFQHRFIYDESRFKIWVKSRQIGGSWGATLDTALSAVSNGQDWVCMSRGLRQATRLLEKVAKHIKAYDAIRTKKYGVPTIIDRIGSERIDLTNGAAIMAMPCDDETTVGDAANVLIDEFGLFPNSEKIFEALTPCILNGFNISIVSSPRGRKNKFAQIFLDPTNSWSKHKTTLFEAERDGLIIRDEKARRMTAQEFIEQLRNNGMSETAIRQEFLCEFLDEAIAIYADSVETNKTEWRLLCWHGYWKISRFNSNLALGKIERQTNL